MIRERLDLSHAYVDLSPHNGSVTQEIGQRSGRLKERDDSKIANLWRGGHMMKSEAR